MNTETQTRTRSEDNEAERYAVDEVELTHVDEGHEVEHEWPGDDASDQVARNERKLEVARNLGQLPREHAIHHETDQNGDRHGGKRHACFAIIARPTGRTQTHAVLANARVFAWRRTFQNRCKKRNESKTTNRTRSKAIK